MASATISGAATAWPEGATTSTCFIATLARRGQPVVLTPACFTVQPDCSSRAMRPSSFCSICWVRTNHQPVHRARPTKTMAKGMISPLRLWRPGAWTGVAWASVIGAV
ncbi:hypothetical protein D3C80_1508190 [compost metagenome]